MNPKVAVVTGGTGFIGWNLCESLRDSDWAVRAVVRASSSNPLPDGVQRVECELDADNMKSACQDAAVVYHLAGLTRATDYDAFARVNVEGARQAALAARTGDAFFLLVSSQAAAGAGTPTRPRKESDEPAPLSLYGKSKLAGERAVVEIEGLRYAIVRPPGVYGPRDRDFLALFRGGKRGFCPLLGDPESAYTFIHVADLVAGLRAVGDSGIAGVGAVMGEMFFVGHADPVRQVDFARLLSATYERRVRTVSVPGWLLQALAAVGEFSGRVTGRPALLNRDRLCELSAPGLVCDATKIARAIGHVARIDAARGFADTAEWYRPGELALKTGHDSAVGSALAPPNQTIGWSPRPSASARGVELKRRCDLDLRVQAAIHRAGAGVDVEHAINHGAIGIRLDGEVILDVDPTDHQRAAVRLDLADGARSQLPVACRYASLLQRTAEGTRHSAGGGGNDVVERRADRVEVIHRDAIVRRDGSMHAEIHRFAPRHGCRTQRTAVAGQRDLRSINDVSHGSLRRRGAGPPLRIESTTPADDGGHRESFVATHFAAESAIGPRVA